MITASLVSKAFFASLACLAIGCVAGLGLSVLWSLLTDPDETTEFDDPDYADGFFGPGND